MNSRRVRLLLVLAALALFVSAAHAQRTGGPPQGRGGAAGPPQNLQVLPKNMPPAQIAEIMQMFAVALGVQCSHCHVAAAQAADGRGRGRGAAAAPTLNFASDDKPEKAVAREMMRLVRDINPRIAASTSASTSNAAPVGCITCHRGVAVPRQLSEILDRAAAENGTPAAIAQYRALRKAYFGAQAYDFAEASLISYAERALDSNKPADAVAWLQVNLEYFPLSSRTYAALAQAQQRTDDRVAAITSLERAVELDPQNAQLKQQLAQLKAK